MPVYTGDYLRDTQHLSMSEHGCYLKLLMHCWDQKGPAPLDERKLCGIVNARSSDEILALRRVLEEFFTKMDDGWYNHRMQREIERSENISKARSTAGKAGYQAKAKQLLSKSQARASTPTPTPTTTTTTTPSPDLPLSGVSQTSKSRGESKPDARATRFTPLPKMPTDWRGYCKAKRPDLNPDLTYEKFSNHWVAKPGAAGRKLDWTATWRNWVLNEGLARFAGKDAIEADKPWHQKASGVQAKGAELGLVPENFKDEYGRLDWQAFRAAVIEAAGGVNA